MESCQFFADYSNPSPLETDKTKQKQDEKTNDMLNSKLFVVRFSLSLAPSLSLSTSRFLSILWVCVRSLWVYSYEYIPRLHKFLRADVKTSLNFTCLYPKKGMMS